MDATPKKAVVTFTGLENDPSPVDLIYGLLGVTAAIDKQQLACNDWEGLCHQSNLARAAHVLARQLANRFDSEETPDEESDDDGSDPTSGTVVELHAERRSP